MVALVWDQVGDRSYESGVDRGVFYTRAGLGTVWNGLVSVTETSNGGEVKPIYLDGKKVFDLVESEDFQADIEAYSSPEAFRAADGIVGLAVGLFATNQPRVTFGFSYRTLKATDTLQRANDYKIHLVYGATAAPTQRTNKTLSNSVDASPLKWTISATPPVVSGPYYKPTAHLIIDASIVPAAKLKAVEDILYGVGTPFPRLLPQTELITLLSA